jgi:hypothetical protein
MKIKSSYLVAVLFSFTRLESARAAQLSPFDEAEAFKAGGYLLTESKWHSDCNEPTKANYDPAAITSVRDLNGDSLPEVVIQEACTSCYGHTGVGFTIVSKQSNNTWKKIVSATGMPTFLKTNGVSGWPDIEFGITGFCLPVWRWDGERYELNRRHEYQPEACERRLSGTGAPMVDSIRMWKKDTMNSKK